MKIVCQRNGLLAAFQIASTVAPARSPKPILQNVLLDVGESESIMAATDMDIGIRVCVEGIQVTTGGRILLPVGRFGPILRESTDETLELESDGNCILVRGQRSRFELPAENPDEFPTVAMFEEQNYHELPARLMKELIRRTLFATDTESSRYALGGVLLEFESEKIIAVGTDGRRLAKMEGPARAHGDHPASDAMTIVPSRSMQLMERAVSEADAEIQLAARANDLLLKTPSLTIYSRLVEGRFPKWRDVLPNRRDAITIELTVGPIYAALRQASVVASDESRGLDFTFGDGSLVLSASTANLGQSRVEMPVPYTGEPLTITLDYRFVADFFKVLDLEKTFSLEVKDKEGAALFTTEDGYGYVVMPLSRDRDR
jgi:DNA polymerase-3 subunit beta